MKIKNLLLLMLPLLLLTACDRFDHSFEPPEREDFAQILFEPLQNALNADEDPLDKAMDYFSEDYLHSGVNKSERRIWLEGFYNANPGLRAELELINFTQNTASTALVNWRLRLYCVQNNVLADSTFTGDRLIKQEARWLIHGNQVSCVVPQLKQIAVLEFFSFQSCDNCPPAEAKLHELQELHGNRLIYLEHHIDGPLVVPNDPTYLYYLPGSVPVTMFQGLNKVNGATSEALEAYEPLVQDILSQDSPLEYKDLSYSLDAQKLTGSVRLQPRNGICDQTDLFLCAAIIEKTSSHTNTHGENIHNLVRGKSITDLRTADLSQPISFDVSCVDDSFEGMALVVFAQRRPSPFQNNAPILSGVEIPITP